MTRSRGSFQPNAPGKGIWLIAVILGGLGILSRFINMGDISIYNYWLLLLGFLLLLFGTSTRRW